MVATRYHHGRPNRFTQQLRQQVLMGHTVGREVVVMAAAVPQVFGVVPVSTEIQPELIVVHHQHGPNLLRMGVLEDCHVTVSGGSVVDLHLTGVATELQALAVDTRVAPEHRVAVSMAALVGHTMRVLTRVMITEVQEPRRLRGVVSVSSLSWEEVRARLV